jgi:hypothetical protein
VALENIKSFGTDRGAFFEWRESSSPSPTNASEFTCMYSQLSIQVTLGSTVGFRAVRLSKRDVLPASNVPGGIVARQFLISKQVRSL